MKRREFITLLGGAAAAWPLAARGAAAGRDAAHRRAGGPRRGRSGNDRRASQRSGRGSKSVGWSEGRNVRIDYRFAAGRRRSGSDTRERTGRAATRRDPRTFAAVAAALQRESRTIPIVFVSVSDPIGSGFVASLARPGGNITGVLQYEASITGKWLAMLKEIAPRLARAALRGQPQDTTAYDYFLRAAEAAAPSLAIELVPSRSRPPPTSSAPSSPLPATPNSGLLLPPDTTTVRPSRSHHRARGPAPLAGGLLRPCFCRGRRSHVLWDRPGRHISAGGLLC